MRLLASPVLGMVAALASYLIRFILLLLSRLFLSLYPCIA